MDLVSATTTEKKKCYKCGVDKKLKQYYKFRYGKPGRMATCKLCLTKAYRLRCLNNTLAKTSEKKCSACGVIKFTKDFYKYCGSDSFRDKCRACTSITSSKRYYKTINKRKPKEVYYSKRIKLEKVET